MLEQRWGGGCNNKKRGFRRAWLVASTGILKVSARYLSRLACGGGKRPARRRDGHELNGFKGAEHCWPQHRLARHAQPAPKHAPLLQRPQAARLLPQHALAVGQGAGAGVKVGAGQGGRRVQHYEPHPVVDDGGFQRLQEHKCRAGTGSEQPRHWSVLGA